MVADTLDRWARQGWTVQEALDLFAALSPVSAPEMIGAWRGTGLATGHVLDGLLEAYGWWGKRFVDPDTVDPLLFERGDAVGALDPGRLPLGLAVALPRIVRSSAAVPGFRSLLPRLKTSQPKARLRMTAWGGCASAAMIYDDLPIIDYFRRVDADLMLGLMEFRAAPEPFFFQLARRR